MSVVNAFGRVGFFTREVPDEKKPAKVCHMNILWKENFGSTAGL